MEKSILDQLYVGIITYQRNHKGESPEAITLHTTKRQEFQELSMPSNNSAAYFNPIDGSMSVFGVRLYFSAYIPEDVFLLSEVHKIE